LFKNKRNDKFAQNAITMNLRDAIEESLRKRPFFEEALQEDLINISSLARLLQPEISTSMGKEVKESALVMAIRRREPRLQLKMQQKLQQFIAMLGDIVIRSNLAAYTYIKSAQLPAKQVRFLETIESDHKAFYSFTGGTEETTIVLSEKYESLLKEVMNGETLLNAEYNLSAITLKLPSSSSEVVGLYYFFFKHIASAGVPIKEIISTTNEATFVVHSNDVNLAFTTINTIKRPV